MPFLRPRGKQGHRFPGEQEGISIRRRRECLGCERRFTTYEKVEEIPYMIVKKDGSRQLFDRQKLLRGMLKACEKRPIAVAKLEEIVEEIESRLQERPEKEMKASEIGQMVMDRLKDLDKVAYVRFASVYREFRDVLEFKQELEDPTPGEIGATPGGTGISTHRALAGPYQERRMVKRIMSRRPEWDEGRSAACCERGRAGRPDSRGLDGSWIPPTRRVRDGRSHPSSKRGPRAWRPRDLASPSTPSRIEIKGVQARGDGPRPDPVPAAGARATGRSEDAGPALRGPARDGPRRLWRTAF